MLVYYPQSVTTKRINEKLFKLFYGIRAIVTALEDLQEKIKKLRKRISSTAFSAPKQGFKTEHDNFFHGRHLSSIAGIKSFSSHQTRLKQLHPLVNTNGECT